MKKISGVYGEDGQRFLPLTKEVLGKYGQIVGLLIHHYIVSLSFYETEIGHIM